MLFALTFTEAGGLVKGNGILVSDSVVVSGMFAPSSITMVATLTTPSGSRAPVTFNTTFIYSKAMFGTVTGGGFTGQAARLEEQE